MKLYTFDLIIKTNTIMRKIFLTVMALSLFAANSSFAQENNDNNEFKKWQVRLRGVGVVPNGHGSPEIIGGNVDIDNSFIPELDFTYFFTKNIAAELILGTTKHDVAVKGTAVGDLDLGSAWLLPPTLTVQYHFYPTEIFKPYVGAGVNYTIFYNEKSGDAAGISYKNKFGYAFQVGFDLMLTDKFFINVDVKKIFLKTDVTVDASNLNGGATLDIPASVKIDPLLLGFGIGMKF